LRKLMRSFYCGFAVLSAASAFLCACAKGQGTGGGGSSGSSGSGVVDCHDVRLLDGPCDSCLHEQCCAELLACFNSPMCLVCSYNSSQLPCVRAPERPISAELIHCAAEKCNPACEYIYTDFDGGPPIPCQDIQADGGVTFADCTAPDMSVM